MSEATTKIVDGQVIPLTPEEKAAIEADWAQNEINRRTPAVVNAERDRRIEAGTMVSLPGIGDIPVSGSPVVQADLTSLAQAAQIAIGAGNTDIRFPFRDQAGTVHSLTADQVVALFMAGVEWLASMRSAAWALIDSDPIPADYADDIHWP